MLLGNKSLSKIREKKDTRTSLVNVSRVSLKLALNMFLKRVTESFLIKLQAFTKMAMKESVMETVLSFGLQRSLFL